VLHALAQCLLWIGHSWDGDICPDGLDAGATGEREGDAKGNDHPHGGQIFLSGPRPGAGGVRVGGGRNQTGWRGNDQPVALLLRAAALAARQARLRQR